MGGKSGELWQAGVSILLSWIAVWKTCLSHTLYCIYLGIMLVQINQINNVNIYALMVNFSELKFFMQLSMMTVQPTVSSDIHVLSVNLWVLWDTFCMALLALDLSKSVWSFFIHVHIKFADKVFMAGCSSSKLENWAFGLYIGSKFLFIPQGIRAEWNFFSVQHCLNLVKLI